MSKSIEEDGQGYVNTAFAQEYPDMLDNELYVQSRTSPDNGNIAAKDDSATDEDKLTVKADDISAMYSVVDKSRKHTKLTEHEISSMYAVVKKNTMSADDTENRRSNGSLPEMDVSEDVSSMYTQVNKKKRKENKDIELGQKDTVEGHDVENANAQSECTNVYQNI
ncbi:uncharacterized protein LOC121385982 [Gigantopelta aegis]|uniref:uncharacterized protein LOC121385982 n=1 Tax=Gigantopelta aegis TaxID=1735272 RepID=UPI001B88B3A2|nr:uncharacterized protein LOC121385982 [Gigantopelta aegis]